MDHLPTSSTSDSASPMPPSAWCIPLARPSAEAAAASPQPPGQPPVPRYPYLDPTRPIEERVEDLLGRMTLDEKIAQVQACWVTRLTREGVLPAAVGAPTSAAGVGAGAVTSDAPPAGSAGGPRNHWLSENEADRLLKHGIGQVSRPAGGTFLPAQQAAELVNEIQRYLLTQTRLGIPALIHEECLSGFMAVGSTVFPQAIGLASTWNPQLVERMAGVIRRQMRLAGANQGLSPLLDVVRDPRWGRVEETFGEDPYLVAAMGAHYVRGLQGPLSQLGASLAAGDAGAATSAGACAPGGIVATLKHFAAHPLSEGGRNCAPVHLGPREFRDLYLWPFEAVVRTVHPGSVMNAYHDIDGVPCAADRQLLTGVLREEWGFDGYVVSDYGAIDMLRHFHHVAADKTEAAALALQAGIDVELPGVDCYGEPLREALRGGRVDEATLDEAVRRHLRYKFRLGLFEHPFVEEAGGAGEAGEAGPGAKLGDAVTRLDTPAERALAAEVARQSIVLLKNDPWQARGPLLPLCPEGQGVIAVIGSHAANARLLMGDYAFTVHRRLEEPTTPTVTILEGIRQVVAATPASQRQVLYAQGCDVRSHDRGGLAAAVALARRAEVAIVAVGERSGLSPNDTSGEGRDQADLSLTGEQEELVRAVAATGTPVVLILVNGRPLALGNLLDQVAAALEVWLPGEEGGTAVADALFGRYNPAGRLPVSVPRLTGQVPVVYNRKPTSWRGYVFADAAPLLPFGHGLSYTRFVYSNLQITVAPSASPQSPEFADVCVDVTNVGERAGDEVVQLYVTDPVASVTRPVQELKGFVRVHLEPDERRTVRFRLYFDQLAFYDARMRRVIEPGQYVVKVGASSQDIRLQGEFALTGSVTPRPRLAHYFSEVEVD